MALFVSILAALSFHFLTHASAVTTLSTDKGYADDIHLASEGSNVYVVWKDGVYADDIAFKAYFARSTDRGLSFEEPILMPTFGRPYNIQLIPSMNNIYFLWSDEGGLYFARSADYGKTIGHPTKMKDTNSDFSFAASGSNVYVSWIDYAPDLDESDDQSNFDVFVRSSRDNGITFSDPINLSDSASYSSNPSMSAVNSSVYVVWEELARTKDHHNNYTVSFAASHDGGITFSNALLIPKSSSASNPSPAISSDPNNQNNFYIVWRSSHSDSPEGKGLLFTKTTDGGNTFAIPILISGNDSAAYSVQILSGNQDSIYVSWKSYSSNRTFSIGFTGSSDGGDSFTAPVVLSNRTGNDSILNMALSPSHPNSLYIVWNEAPVWGGDVGPQLGSEVLLGRSDNGGKSFHPIVNLNKDSDNTLVYHSDIAVSEGNVYIVWNHYDDEGSDVRFVRSTDAGITFDIAPRLEIDIQTDKKTYSADENVTITGHVPRLARPNVDDPQNVVILEFGNVQDGFAYFVDVAPLSQDGSFKYVFQGEQLRSTSLTQTVRALYDCNAPAEALFNFITSYERPVMLGAEWKTIRAVIGGEEYPIKYAMTGGSLRGIVGDIELATITLELDTVSDGELLLELPKGVNDALGPSPEVFIDTIPSEPELLYVGDDLTAVRIEFKHGTEEIELVGPYPVMVDESSLTLPPIEQLSKSFTTKNYAKVNGEEFFIWLIISGADSCVSSFSQENKNLQVELTGKDSNDGRLSVYLPTRLFSGNFTVFIDGKEQQNTYVQKEAAVIRYDGKDNEFTIVEQRFNWSNPDVEDTITIQVYASRVLPEFSVLISACVFLTSGLVVAIVTRFYFIGWNKL